MMLAKYWKLHQSSEKQWTVLFLCGCGKIDIYAWKRTTLFMMQNLRRRIQRIFQSEADYIRD